MYAFCRRRASAAAAEQNIALLKKYRLIALTANKLTCLHIKSIIDYILCRSVNITNARNFVFYMILTRTVYVPVTVMFILYWRIWRETEKRYKDLTTLFLVSARLPTPKTPSSRSGFWRNLLAAPSAVVGAVVKGGGEKVCHICTRCDQVKSSAMNATVAVAVLIIA